MIWKDRIKQYPHRYTLTNVSGSTYDFAEVTGDVTEAGTPVNAENLNKLIQRDGDDIKDTVTTFTEASTRANIATGESTATLFGKIKKWFSDIKPHAFNDLDSVPISGSVKPITSGGVYNEFALKAPLANPTFTGTVTVPIEPSGPSSAVSKSYADGLSTPYSKVIRTQAEFNELINSPNWLGATSVALVGQFTLSTPGNSGVQIPATVKQIHGFNGAKITVTNFLFNPSTSNGGLWYDTLPTTLDYSIRDLEVDCTGGGAVEFGFGFRRCSNLTNCTGTGTGTSGYGFYDCMNLTNCTGTGTGTGYGYGFRQCTNLTNCTGTGTGTGYGYGFRQCTNLTNCTGTGTGTTEGYGFYEITTASNCLNSDFTTAMWGGTNTNIDIDTCRKTPVAADNTTLNT